MPHSSLQEAKARLAEVNEQITAMADKFRGKKFDEEANGWWVELNAERDQLLAEIDEVGAREKKLQDIARNPGSYYIEPGDDRFERPEARERRVDTSSPGWVAREQALRLVDGTKELSAKAGDRLDKVIRSDRGGIESAYLLAVADESYRSAFGKLLLHGQAAPLHWGREEQAAVERMHAAERAMSVGTTTAGGFGVPYTLDPSIVLSSSGRLSPIRQLARTETIPGSNEWRGVSSDGVVSNWYAEAAEVSDDSPTLAQPTATARRASTFVPFSIELEGDYETLLQQLGALISDAKDVLESDAFYNGLAANNAPIGVLATTGGLVAGQRIASGGASTIVIAGLYSFVRAVPARFSANSTLVANASTLDAIYRLTPSGSTTEPQAMPTRDGPVLNVPQREWSSLPNVGAGAKVAVVGDWKSGYVIVDRVGMQIELVPHLLGATRRPSGQRGLFAWWRVGASVLVPNALRYMEVAAT